MSPVPLRRHRLAEPLRQHHLGAATDRAARVLTEAAVHCVRGPAAWMVKGGGTSVVAAPQRCFRAATRGTSGPSSALGSRVLPCASGHLEPWVTRSAATQGGNFEL